MANIKYGPLVADVRGSVGGTCFSRGSGGGIVRNAPKPCNPRTPLQVALRARLAMLTAYWSKTMDQPHRDQWSDYAAGTSWSNKVGGSAIITGLAAFVRFHTTYLQWGGDIVEDGPTMVGHAGTPSFTITANPTAYAIGIAQPTAPWVNNATGNMIGFYVHAPSNAGRVVAPSLKNYVAMAAGSPGAPPAWPKAITSPFAFYAGQRISVTGIYLDLYRRLGGDYTAQVIAAVP
jgi:hypothetical protein